MPQLRGHVSREDTNKWESRRPSCADDYFELTMDTFMQHAKMYAGGGGAWGKDVAWNVVDKSAGY